MCLPCKSSFSLPNIGLFLTITGLFFSRIALSVGMALLFGNAAIYWWRSGKQIGLQVEVHLLLYALLFPVFLLTGFYSTDKVFFWERIRNRF